MSDFLAWLPPSEITAFVITMRLSLRQITRTFAAVFALLITTAPALAEQYLCVPDKATGFFYNKDAKEWQSITLKTSQFVVISPSKNPKVAYSLTGIGKPKGLPGGFCEKDFNDMGLLFCTTLGGEVKFNRVNGRFVRTYVFAYYTVGLPGPLNETDENTGSLWIEIGKCAAF
jgi:hypothetical protein